MTPQQNLGNSEMLQQMGRPAPDGAAVDAAAQRIREQFIGLETGLQQITQQIGELFQTYPAFGGKSQVIGQAIEQIHGALNEGMLESIRSLGEQETAAPPPTY